MTTAAIEDATSGDGAAIASLHRELFSPSWSAAEVADLMAHPGTAAFVVREAQVPGVAGYVIGRVAADEAEILSIGVAMARRRQGHGRRLVHKLAERVATMGAIELFLEVSAVNASAVALYRALGFRQIGMRRGYYRPPGQPAEDALLLALDLAANRRVD